MTIPGSVSVSVRTRTLLSPGRSGQVTAGLLAAAAWAFMAAGYAAGVQHLLSHDAILGHGELPLPLAALVFAAAWQIMIAAMMLPTALPVVGAFSRQDGRRALLTLVMAAEKMLPGWRRTVSAVSAVGAGLGIAGVLVALA